MKPRRFEFVEGTSAKFWEIWIDGVRVHTRYGRIGATGAETLKDEGDAAKAKKLYEKLVAEKTKKGYVETSGGGTAAKAAAPPKAAKPAAKAAPPAKAAKPAAKAAKAAPAAKPAKPAPTAKPAKAAPPAKPAAGATAILARIAAKAKAASVALRKGASAKALAVAEKALGFALPDDVRAFYQAHDGSDDDEAVEGRELLSLERMVSEWKIWKGLLDRGDFADNDHGEPGPGVQQKWWIPEWVPLTYDGSGNHHVLDLAPGKKGTYGQILSFWHDEASREVVGKSLLAWLDTVDWGAPDEDEDGADEDAGKGGEDEAADKGGGDVRRFEMAGKFWSISLDDAAVTVRFGKQGTDGQEKTKEHGSAADAKKEYDKLVKEKTGKGYVDVS